MRDYNTNPERLRKAQGDLIKFQEEIKAAAMELTAATKRFKEQNSDDAADVVKMIEDIVKAIDDFHQEFEDLSKMIDRHLSNISLIQKILHTRYNV